MKKVMCGVLMLGWIPTLAVVAGVRWTEALFAQGRTPLKVTRKIGRASCRERVL